jgi:hypothetical protein
MIESRRMRLAEHVARMGDKRGGYGVLLRRLEGKSYLGNLGVDGRLIFILSSRTWPGSHAIY